MQQPIDKFDNTLSHLHLCVSLKDTIDGHSISGINLPSIRWNKHVDSLSTNWCYISVLDAAMYMYMYIIIYTFGEFL